MLVRSKNVIYYSVTEKESLTPSDKTGFPVMFKSSYSILLSFFFCNQGLSLEFCTTRKNIGGDTGPWDRPRLYIIKRLEASS